MKRVLIIFLLSFSVCAIAQVSVPTIELITVAGTNTYTATVPIAPGSASAIPGYKKMFKFTNANSGASTFNLSWSVSGGGTWGAITLRKSDGTALSSGDIPAGSVWWLVHDGTASQWRLTGGSGSAFALTPGSGTTVGADLTSVDLGGNQSGDVYINTATNSFSVYPQTAGGDISIGGDINESDGDRADNVAVAASDNIGLNTSSNGVNINETTGSTFRGTTLFPNSGFRIRNPATTFNYTFVGSAIAANRNITLPLLSNNDTFTFNAASQTLTNKTFGNGTNFSLSPTISAGVKFAFFPSATAAGFNWGQITSDPSAPPDGDTWYRSDTDIYKGRSNGVTRDFITDSDTQTLTNKSLSGSSNNFTNIPISTAISGLGTGVSTALGVNVGSAGSVVVNGGAGGTPSSIGLGNGTGLPLSGITGLGTGVATWLTTPSWTNFNSAITGTAPFWSLTSGGSATGTNTFAMGSNPLIITTGATTGTGATAGLQLSPTAITTGNAFDIGTSGNTLSNGSLIRINSSSTGIDHTEGTNGLIRLTLNGAMAGSKTAIGASSIVTTTGTNSLNIAQFLGASGATDNYALKTSGKVMLGTSQAAGGTYFSLSTDPMMIIKRTVDPDDVNSSHGFLDLTLFNKNAANNANNAYDDAGKTLGTVDYNHHTSFQARWTYGGTGTIANYYGMGDVPQSSSSGPITNRYSFYSGEVSGGTSPITNDFGLYVATRTRATNKWGVYVENSNSYFGGSLMSLGTTNKLQISTDFGGSGELLSGAFAIGTGGSNFSIGTNAVGTVGKKLVGVYYSGGYLSAFEVANVASGFGNLSLMKSGGTVTIGTAAGTAKLHLGAETATASTEPIRFTVPAAQTSSPVSQGLGVNTAGTKLTYVNASATRLNVVTDNGTALTSGTIPIASTTGYLIDSGILSPSTGIYSIGGGSATAGTLRLIEDTDDGSNYSEFKSGVQSSNVTYTLPTAAPTVNGSTLSSTTAGFMSWLAPIQYSGNFSGAGTATTVFTVTIGATMANNTYEVFIEPTGLLSAAVQYVTNKTTTTFDVTYAAGLTGTVTFDWEVIP